MFSGKKKTFFISCKCAPVDPENIQKQFFKFVIGRGLYGIKICAELVRGLNAVVTLAGGEHDHFQSVERQGAVPNFAEAFQSVFARHIDVQKQQFGNLP